MSNAADACLLREYQSNAVDEIGRQIQKHRVLLVSPTGSGKTVIAAHYVRNSKHRRVLWLAHRSELVEQAADHLRRIGLDVGIVSSSLEKSGVRPNLTAPIQVASVQTATRRSGLRTADLIVIDEAHHVLADSYRRIVVGMPTARVLGLTATPVRYDGKPLRAAFDHMIEAAKPSALYASGHLSRPVTYSLTGKEKRMLSDNLRSVRVRGGEFDTEQLDRAMNTKQLVGAVVSDYRRYLLGGPAAIYASSVEHSRAIAEALVCIGIRAEHIDGTTPLDVRQAVLAGLRDGHVEVVCNYAVLTEGWDLPGLAGVVIARATRSLGLYMQMVGRCMRTHRGRIPIVIDHGLNWERHRVVPGDDVEWSLNAGRVSTGQGKGREADADVERDLGDPVELNLPLRELDESDSALANRLRRFGAARGAPDGWAERVAIQMAGRQ